MQKIETHILGTPVKVEIGSVATQTDGSCLFFYGDTVVLATAVTRTLDEPPDFFPLIVEYRERTYAAGKIPGGFIKREGRPSTKEVIISRMIDRPIRPLFPKDLMQDTQVMTTLLSADPLRGVDIAAMNASFTALHISDIPFKGPVAAVKIGYIAGEYVINPTYAQLQDSQMEIIMVASEASYVMIEASANELDEDTMIKALDFGFAHAQEYIQLQHQLRKLAGKPKKEYVPFSLDLEEAMHEPVRAFISPRIPDINHTADKLQRQDAISDLIKQCRAQFSDYVDQDSQNKNRLSAFIDQEIAEHMRQMIMNEGRRIDGRANNQVRPITTRTGFLPQVHGSGLFKRGETQVLSTVTLGSSEDEQVIDTIGCGENESFMLHYNFPPYSVHEVKPIRGPGRREIGHGVLAKKAFKPLIPDKDSFPYTIRIVSEVLESNGSSSMATVASASMALMDTGVPMPKHVAGVAMGLITEGDRWQVLTDILGQEDHLGDMDFKIAGTVDGITAIQLDVKIPGISEEILRKVFYDAKQGRCHIIDHLTRQIAGPRKELSPSAPRIETIQLKNLDKVRDIIGPGGKTIRKIIEETGVKIDIDQQVGVVNIFSSDQKGLERAQQIIDELIAEPEIGKVYDGVVNKIATFGAFVEIMPNVTGLLHISEIDEKRIPKVTDVLNVGDAVKVLVLDVDKTGKIRLSRRRLLHGKDKKHDTDSRRKTSS